MAWNTGSRSPGEREMTCSTSEVAVCCSSASVLAGARLYFVEQPHVLDRDYGLVGEGRDQVARFASRKWPRRRSRHRHDADTASVPEQRDTEHRTVVAAFVLMPGVFRIGESVGYVNRCNSSTVRATSVPDRARSWMLSHKFLIFR